MMITGISERHKVWAPQLPSTFAILVLSISPLPLPGRFLYLIKLRHVYFDATGHFLRGFVLPVVVDEITIRINEVCDDRVIHLSMQHKTTHTKQDFVTRSVVFALAVTASVNSVFRPCQIYFIHFARILNGFRWNSSAVIATTNRYKQPCSHRQDVRCFVCVSSYPQ